MEITKLFDRERRMWKQIEKDTERYAELMAEATAVKAFTYEQDKVIGTIDAGSKQENLVPEYVDLEEKIEKEKEKWNHLRFHLFALIQNLHPKEQQVIKAYYMDHKSRQEIQEKLQMPRRTFFRYHSNSLVKLEEMLKK